MDPVEHTFTVCINFDKYLNESVEIVRLLRRHGPVTIYGDAVVMAGPPMTAEETDEVQKWCDDLTAKQSADQKAAMLARQDAVDPNRPVLVPTPEQVAATNALLERASEVA